MSDVADRADWRIEQDLQNALAHARQAPTLESDGHCHFCEEVVAYGRFFCNADCRDDFDKEQSALRRMGRHSA